MILLIQPPLTQLNTPYPAITHLTSFLRSKSIDTQQADLGIELIDRLFTRQNLTKIFAKVEEQDKLPKSIRNALCNKNFYIDKVEAVIAFLRGEKQSNSTLFSRTDFWENMPRIEAEEELEYDYGVAGNYDRAKYLCSLFIKNITDVIHIVDKHFELIRYAEHLCTYITHFDIIKKELCAPRSIVTNITLEILEEKLELYKPDFVAFSVPFPGNLLQCIFCAEHIKRHHPKIKTIMGGGYVNTELRKLTDPGIFGYIDYITYDDGELPLLRIVTGGELIRTAVAESREDEETKGLIVEETKSLRVAVAESREDKETKILKVNEAGKQENEEFNENKEIRDTSLNCLAIRARVRVNKNEEFRESEQIEGLNSIKVVKFYNAESKENIPFAELPAPTTDGLPMNKYLNFTDSTNPMHRLWSDGKWNKMMLAHGCYWAKCAFCDTTLDYICRFERCDIGIIVDRMEALIAETDENGFHFVDEAAPPAVLRQLAEEIIKRKLTVSYWTNIRFDRSFTPELCWLLAKSGCIAVSGGLEVASPRVLKLINKGVTIESATECIRNLSEHNIMVHTYLMYGFPSQTEAELFDSLGRVRDLFAEGLIQSAFWHRYAMTCHSSSGKNPESVGAKAVEQKDNPFANNEIPFIDPLGIDWEKWNDGLNLATYNYMRGTGFDVPLKQWFSFLKNGRKKRY
ncbi:MAG: B12-binding domain-containing radical SAM protein [Candidatus Aphodosoma sp.]